MSQFSKVILAVSVTVGFGLLGTWLGLYVGSEWSESFARTQVAQDISPELRGTLQQVIQSVTPGLQLGQYSFDSKPTPLGPTSRTFMTLQKFTPVQAYTAIKNGFPIERFETDQVYQVWKRTIPAGRYYLILWMSNQGFERFGLAFKPRTPLLIFIKEQSLELVDFGIACKVEVEVPHPNPDQVASLAMFDASKDCAQGAGASLDGQSMSSSMQTERAIASDTDHWGMTTWGIAKVVLTVAEAKLKNASIELPPFQQLFPGQQEQGGGGVVTPPPPPPQ